MQNIVKPTIYVLLTVIAVSNLFGQTAYSGFVGKFPIRMVTNIYSDGAANATYLYDNFDEPIKISGKLYKNKLTLYEKDVQKIARAALTFDNFDAKTTNLTGVWTNVKTGEKLDITLKKDFEIDTGEGIEYTGREIIQSDSLPDKYFTVVVSKTKDDYYGRAAAVKIFEKKTDRLIQQIDFEGNQRGAESVSIGDYNFDGIQDFSVFESSYAGANTSSLYFLYNPKTKKFFNSGFEGTSLEFDEKKKQIFETNQCCAGSITTTATYRVVKNKMIRIEEHCYIWDEKKGDRVEKKMKACQ